MGGDRRFRQGDALEVVGMMLNVVSDYALQVGCEVEEKERF